MSRLCKKIFLSGKSEERGEVMLEGMIIVTMTIFILIWLLGVGFLYYQRTVVTIATNDAAVKIASTYNNPTSDIIMGYVTTEDLSNRDLYRGFTFTSKSSDLKENNRLRAEQYVAYMVKKANFANTVDGVTVQLDLETDSIARRHVKVTTTCTFNTPFGAVLKIFGMGAQSTYQATACADCTDVADYISTVNFSETLASGDYLSGDKFVSSLLKMIDKLVGVFNKPAS